MQIVRKQLTSDTVAPKTTRINPDTGNFQTSPDGGVTWVDNSGADPRDSTWAHFPALTTESAQCDAAARITAAFQTLLEALYQEINVAQFASAGLELLLLLFQPAGWIIDALLIVGGALITLGVATIEAAFTSDVWDGILCIIYNRIDSDGQMSASQLADILSDIASAYPGTVSTTVNELVQLFGSAGLSNAGVERTETGNCGACGTWCDLATFADAQYSWANAPFGGTVYGAWAGDGFVATLPSGSERLYYDWIFFNNDVPLTGVRAWATFSDGGGGNSGAPTGVGSLIAIWSADGTTNYAQLTNPGDGLHVVEYVGAVPAGGLWIQNLTWDGAAKINAVEFKGNGTDPEYFPPCP